MFCFELTRRGDIAVEKFRVSDTGLKCVLQKGASVLLDFRHSGKGKKIQISLPFLKPRKLLQEVGSAGCARGLRYPRLLV